jgi:hypothetical protein
MRVAKTIVTGAITPARIGTAKTETEKTNQGTMPERTAGSSENIGIGRTATMATLTAISSRNATAMNQATSTLRLKPQPLLLP